MANRSRITCISWTRESKSCEYYAQALGATTHFVCYGQKGRSWQAPIRYLVQGWQTLRILYRERPRIVMAENPPVFAPAVVALYALFFGADYIINSHTSAFISQRWRWALPLHRFLSRRALTTVVHNGDLETIVQGWGCPVHRVGFVSGEYPAGEPYPLDGRYSIAVICSFDSDEPIAEILAAAEQLPEVAFYITGDDRRLPPDLRVRMSPNCHLTGFLPYSGYVGLLRGVDAIMDLTNWDHTVLFGGFEAASLGKPLITSDWPVLRECFPLGTVHVENTAEAIRQGVAQARREKTRLREEVVRLRERLERDWEQQIGTLKRLCDRALEK